MTTHETVMGFGIPPEERFPMTQVPDWEHNSIRLVSGLSHNYLGVVWEPAGVQAVSGPKPGERAPDAQLVLDPKKRLYDLTRHPGFTLLAVPCSADGEATIAVAKRVRDELAQRHPGRVRSFLIGDGGDETGFDFDHRTPDETGEIRERWELGDEGRIIVVRSDLYVGLNLAIDDGDRVIDYLDTWFVPAYGLEAVA